MKKHNVEQVEKKSMNQSIEDAEKFKKIDDHRISFEQFEKRYETNLKVGLTEEAANQRLLLEG